MTMNAEIVLATGIMTVEGSYPILFWITVKTGQTIKMYSHFNIDKMKGDFPWL